jgi:hypothetical protein
MENVREGVYGRSEGGGCERESTTGGKPVKQPVAANKGEKKIRWDYVNEIDAI